MGCLLFGKCILKAVALQRLFLTDPLEYEAALGVPSTRSCFRNSNWEEFIPGYFHGMWSRSFGKCSKIS